MSKMRKVLVTTALAAALSIVGAPFAAADPAFGPGNGGGGQGNSGPSDGKCHPPGQTTTTPGCK
jgi:hypothetical protein